jgi:LemA protein
MLWIYILLGFLVVGVIFYTIWVYNRLIHLRNLADEGWSGIEVQLKKRHDLVPNLVNTVKAYADFEQSTLTKVIQQRNQAVQTAGVAQKAQQEDMLSQTLRQLFALSEDYPQLKANQNYLKLQEQLTEIEDTLSKARRYYNGTVRNLNTKIQSFPDALIAKPLDFQTKEYFEASSGDRQNVVVEV